MMTSIECLAKADELDAIALRCANESDRAGYSRTADGWRRNAAMALGREAWGVLPG